MAGEQTGRHLTARLMDQEEHHRSSALRRPAEHPSYHCSVLAGAAWMEGRLLVGKAWTEDWLVRVRRSP